MTEKILAAVWLTILTALFVVPLYLLWTFVWPVVLMVTGLFVAVLFVIGAVAMTDWSWRILFRKEVNR